MRTRRPRPVSCTGSGFEHGPGPHERFTAHTARPNASSVLVSAAGAAALLSPGVPSDAGTDRDEADANDEEDRNHVSRVCHGSRLCGARASEKRHEWRRERRMSQREEPRRAKARHARDTTRGQSRDTGAGMKHRGGMEDTKKDRSASENTRVISSATSSRACGVAITSRRQRRVSRAHEVTKSE